MVAQVADAVVAGYALAWLVLDELQIFDVVVHPHYRRRGLARQLLLALLDERYLYTSTSIYGYPECFRNILWMNPTQIFDSTI